MACRIVGARPGDFNDRPSVKRRPTIIAARILGRDNEADAGGVPLLRGHGIRDVARGRRRDRAGRGAGGRRPARRCGAEDGRAGARARQSQGRARRGDRRRHRPHRRRAHACAREQRGARALAPGAASAIIRRCCRAIAASPRSSGRSSRAIRSPAARSITSRTAGMRARSPRRTGASSARARRRASCGSARWRRWDFEAAGAGRAARARARQRARRSSRTSATRRGRR